MCYGGDVKPDEFKDLIDNYFGWPLKYIYNWNLVQNLYLYIFKKKMYIYFLIIMTKI